MTDWVEETLSGLSLDEKIALLAGADLWHTVALPERGVRSIRVSDGPAGVRGTQFAGGPSSAVFPCATALGATWDTALVRRVGEALGREAHTKGAAVHLAPTVNLHRTPIGGRNFECFSEDPALTARMAVAYVQGVQSQGVASCIKHFVANDTEFERMTISSEVSARVLRELYLVPFEAAVKEAGVRSVMSSYNRLNGVYAADHQWLLQDVLRGEWGFTGAVISDWFGLHSTAEGVRAGTDLEMPGPSRHRGRLLRAAVEAGEVDEALIDASARRVLGLVEWCGPSGGDERAVDDPHIRSLVREAAAAGTVLLRNEDGVLPLAPEQVRRVALIGPNGQVGETQGGGSARVRAHRVAAIADALAARGVAVSYERGCLTHKLLPAMSRRVLGPAGLAVTYRNGASLDALPVAEVQSPGGTFMWMTPPADGLRLDDFAMTAAGTFTATESGEWQFSCMTAGRARLWLGDELVVDAWDLPPGFSYFGWGSQEQRATRTMTAGEAVPVRIEYVVAGTASLGALHVGCLPPVPADLMERAEAAAAAADAAIVVVGTNDEWESEGFDRDTMDLPGAQAELIRRVAAANPRTIVVVNAGSPVTMDWGDDVPAVLQIWFPGMEIGEALADVVFGSAEPGGRLPTTIPARLEDTPAYAFHPGRDGRAEYGEGLHLGYRHYERNGVKPRFPFGFGLGYTSFAWSDAELAVEGDHVHVSVTVTNTGSRPGAEVVQCYVAPPPGAVETLGRAPQELRAFAKVTVGAGGSQRVRLTLNERAFAHWDDGGHGWAVAPGVHEVRLARSSADVVWRAPLARP